MSRIGSAAVGTVLVAGLLVIGPPVAGQARADPMWSAPVALSAAGRSADKPSVGVSADGSTATAVWVRQNDDSEWVVQVATRAGSAWSAPVTLSGPGANNPQVAVSADGSTATAVWQVFVEDTGGSLVQASTRTAGVWSAPVNLSDPALNSQYPTVAISADGSTATVAWFQWGAWVVQASTRTGTTWSGPETLSTAGAGAFVDMSADGSTATTAWSSIGTPARAEASTRSGGTWSGEEFISADEGYNAFTSSVAVSGDGTTAMVVWAYHQNEFVQAATRTAAGWGNPVQVSPVETYWGVGCARVGLSSNGSTAVVLWQRNNGTQSQVAASTRTGSTWPTPVILSAPTERAFLCSDGGNAQLDVAADGSSAIAVWWEYQGSRTVKASTGLGSTWSTPVPLSPVGSATDMPQVGVSATGAIATTVWKQLDLGLWIIKASTMGTPPEPTPEPTTAPTPIATPPIATPPGTTATTIVTGWPKKAAAKKGKVTVKVTVTPAEGRKGTVQKKTCKPNRPKKCTWKGYVTLTWPGTPTGTRKITLRAKTGQKAVYRLVLPATSTATAATTRPVTVKGR